MATLTTEQIEQKKQQLKQLAEDAQQLKNELVEAGAWPLDENELDEAAGGTFYKKDTRPIDRQDPNPDPFPRRFL